MTLTKIKKKIVFTLPVTVHSRCASRTALNNYKARELSEYSFVLSIFPCYAVSSSIIPACIHGDKLRILSYKGVGQNGNIRIKYYDSLQEYINHRFGSFKVYLETQEQIFQSMNEDMID